MDKGDIKNLENIYNEDDSLEKRLGVIEKTDDIFISSLGVVSGKINMNQNDFYNKEVTFNEFVKKIDKNIDLGLNKIKYDKASNSFYLIIKNSFNHHGGIYRGGYLVTAPTARKLVLDNETMDDYYSGKCNMFTFILDELCKKSQDKDKTDAENEIIDQKKKELIAKAENNPNKLSLLEAKAYYDYLKDNDKQIIKDITKITSKTVVIAGPPVGVGIITAVGLFEGHPLGIVAGVLSAFATTMIEDLVLTFTDKKDEYLIFKSFNYIKEWTKDVSEKVKKIRINRLKEKGLIKLYSVDKVVMPNSVTVVSESNEIEELDLDDHIMKELDVMIGKMSSINAKDREILLGEAKSLLNTYIDRKTDIISRDKNNKDYNGDNLISLRNDMCGELAKMEIKLNNIKNIDLKTKKIIDEGKLLTDKIENIEYKELKLKKRIVK